ncbi:MAG: hypothetical protein GMKNLPBB_02027 [Myxococcota bacterium]|nr:hypothetical protein [Myxococcota bacterium]
MTPGRLLMLIASISLSAAACSDDGAGTDSGISGGGASDASVDAGKGDGGQNPLADGGGGAADAGAGDSGGVPPDAGQGGGQAVSFADLHKRLFALNCSAVFCHGGANPTRGLKLDTRADAYKTMVGVKSPNNGVTRVQAGDPAASLVLRVLKGESDGVRRMPPGAPVDAKLIEEFEQWIKNGAQDN